MNSRDKGKRGELELAKYLSDRGFLAKRGQQFHGGADSPDVACASLPGIHIEAKRVERGALYDWLAQAIRDAGKHKTPVVMHRKNKEEWVAILRLEDFLSLFLSTGA